MNFGRIDTERKSVSEQLHANGALLGVSLQQFWQWAGSDLISNSQRGILAEFLVAHALGVDSGVRTEWDASTNTSATEADRPADVYVFAEHAHID
ncbi:hypothetical protein [Vulcanococcus limneticus]|uniref:hypothetical protein n=1 Tax=Vulcanococcus limneticus TaxID=2170428 RepID=UPI00398C006A